MSDNESSTSSTPSEKKGGEKGKAKGKKGKNNNLYLYGGAALAAGLIYYLYTKHAANTAATTASTTPTSDPLQGTDPNSPTGQTYAQELADNGLSGIDPNSATGQTYQQEITGNTADLSTIETELAGLVTGNASVNGTSTSGGSTNPTATVASWSAAANAALQKAGLTPAEAAASVSNYLAGHAVNNTTSVNVLNALPKPPVTGGANFVAVLSKSGAAAATAAAAAAKNKNPVVTSPAAKVVSSPPSTKVQDGPPIPAGYKPPAAAKKN